MKPEIDLKDNYVTLKSQRLGAFFMLQTVLLYELLHFRVNTCLQHQMLLHCWAENTCLGEPPVGSARWFDFIESHCIQTNIHSVSCTPFCMKNMSIFLGVSKLLVMLQHFHVSLFEQANKEKIFTWRRHALSMKTNGYLWKKEHVGCFQWS